MSQKLLSSTFPVVLFIMLYNKCDLNSRVYNVVMILPRKNESYSKSVVCYIMALFFLFIKWVIRRQKCRTLTEGISLPN